MASPNQEDRSSTGHGLASGPHKPADACYEIRVAGELDPCWRSWFDGMELEFGPAGETRLSGPVADQAALHGLLARIRDLNLTLISVRRLAGTTSEGEEEHVSA